MQRPPRGFTIIELVIALLIGSILTSIALSSWGDARGRAQARGARTAFAALHARARAQAIERGATVRMLVDVAGDSVVLVSGGQILEKIQFGGELNVDIQSGAGAVRLCMSPRGYADTNCNSFSTPVSITFRRSADTASVTLLPMGQLIY